MNKPPHRDELRGIKYETLREPGMSIMEQGGGGGGKCVGGENMCVFSFLPQSPLVFFHSSQSSLLLPHPSWRLRMRNG